MTPHTLFLIILTIYIAPIAIIDKRRPEANKCEVMNIIGDVAGKDCILIDDMIDTAGTICGLSGTWIFPDQGFNRFKVGTAKGDTLVMFLHAHPSLHLLLQILHHLLLLVDDAIGFVDGVIPSFVISLVIPLVPAEVTDRWVGLSVSGDHG